MQPKASDSALRARSTHWSSSLKYRPKEADSTNPKKMNANIAKNLSNFACQAPKVQIPAPDKRNKCAD